MDPVTLIVTALATGAAAALNETAGQAVRDAYLGLKRLLRGKLQGTAGADVVLERHERDPEAWGPGVRAILAEANAADDDELLSAARRLLELADPEGASVGKYKVSVRGGQVGVIGDHGTAYMGVRPEPPSGTGDDV